MQPKKISQLTNPNWKAFEASPEGLSGFPEDVGIFTLAASEVNAVSPVPLWGQESFLHLA